MERIRILALAAALALASLPAGEAAAQETGPAWSVVPEVGVVFHGDFYDGRVVTIVAGSDVAAVDRLRMDPGTALRLGARVEKEVVPAVRLHGGVGASWPGASVRRREGDEAVRSEVDVSVVEISGGATLRLGEITAAKLPIYVGAELGLVRHGFDDLSWEGEFVDPTATSLSLGGRLGVEYPLAPGVSLRGELRQTLVRGGYGDLEEEISEVETRLEGAEAAVDFEDDSFSIFSLNAGLSVSF